jgi:hypothetical protein
MAWTGEKDVAHLVKITLSGYYFSEVLVSPDQRARTFSPVREVPGPEAPDWTAGCSESYLRPRGPIASSLVNITYE